MARNEEKQLGRLNRLWLQQLNEEQAKKDPPRPGLGSLHSAAEVKKWLPSIKRDIDFCLKQSQVACYPERQIEEFSLKIEQLTKEYKAYVRKLRELEPGLTEVPWTDRAYTRKRKKQQDTGDGELGDENEPESGNSNSKTRKDNIVDEVHHLLQTPVLDNEETDSTSPQTSEDKFHHLLSTPVLDNDNAYEALYGHEEPAQIVYNSDPNREDAPLDFNFGKNPMLSHRNVGVLKGKNKSSMSNKSDLQSITCSVGTSASHSNVNKESELLSNCKVENSLSKTTCDNYDYCICNTDAKMKTGTNVHSELSPATCKCVTAQRHDYCEPAGDTWARGTRTESSVQRLGGLNLPYSDSSDEDG